MKMLYEFKQEDNMQFCLVDENGKEFDWIDPVKKIYQDDYNLYVENYYYHLPWDFPINSNYKVQKRND